MGSEQTIEWTTFGNVLSGTINLDLPKDGSYQRNIGSINIQAGKFTWTIPGSLEPSTRYQVHALSSSSVGVVFTTRPFEIVTSSSETDDGDGDGDAGLMTTIAVVSTGVIFALIFLLCCGIAVALLVIVVVVVMSMRVSKGRNTDHTEISTMALSTQQLFDMDADEAIQDEGITAIPRHTRGNTTSNILSSNMLTSGERSLAEKMMNEFNSLKKCPAPDVMSAQNIGEWLRVSLCMLESEDTKECGMEMACVLWEIFGTGQHRLEALRQHPQLLVLLQAGVLKSGPSDWSFVERIQRGMGSFDANAKHSELELTNELGSGAYGSVHVATRSDNGNTIAVKVIKHMKRTFDGEALQEVIDVRKIKREILIMSIFAMDNNPHLIHFIGHQVEEMRVLILMARAQGNVKDLLQQNRMNRKQLSSGETTSNVGILSVGAKLDIALQVAEALAFLHSFEIAHRDLKSENILLMNKITPETPTTSVRLIEFGIISRATQDAHSTFIQGTVSWVAPEVLQAGERGATSPSGSNSSESASKKKTKVTTAVDVYSFAYLLWALLTEREPHSNYGQSVELIKSQVRSNANCPLTIPSFDQLPDSSAASSASEKFSVRMFEAFKSLMLGCWHSDPNRRPTMPQVVEAIKSIQKMIKN